MQKYYIYLEKYIKKILKKNYINDYIRVQLDCMCYPDRIWGECKKNILEKRCFFEDIFPICIHRYIYWQIGEECKNCSFGKNNSFCEKLKKIKYDINDLKKIIKQIEDQGE